MAQEQQDSVTITISRDVYERIGELLDDYQDCSAGGDSWPSDEVLELRRLWDSFAPKTENPER